MLTSLCCCHRNSRCWFQTAVWRAEQRLAAGKVDIPKSLYQGLKDMIADAAAAPAPQPTSTLPHPAITSITLEAASISSTSPTVTSTTPDVTGTTPHPNSVSSLSPGLSSTSTGKQKMNRNQISSYILTSVPRGVRHETSWHACMHARAEIKITPFPHVDVRNELRLIV